VFESRRGRHEIWERISSAPFLFEFHGKKNLQNFSTL